MRHLVGHAGAVRALCYLPDGRLASGEVDRRVRIRGVAEQPELVIETPGIVYALAASPDGRALRSRRTV